MSTPEDIREDGKREDAEDKRREFLERRTRMGGPEAPEPCERCDGKGSLPQFVTREMAIDAGDIEMQGQEIATSGCEACRGTGQRLVAGEESGQLCGECAGGGFTAETFPPSECPRCLGTGVQP